MHIFQRSCPDITPEIMLIFFLISVLQFVLCFSWYSYTPLKIHDYTYPDWANILGWSIGGVSFLAIPIEAVVQFCKAKGTLKEVDFIDLEYFVFLIIFL